MTRQHLLHGASLIAALLLASCANGPGAEMDPEAAFPITVGPHMERVTLNSPAEAGAKLGPFASAFKASGNGSITITAPNPEAARTVADKLAALGVPRDHIVVGGMSQTGTVELSYVGYGASSPTCANWDENIAFTFYNLPTPNFGCATQHNIAVMAAEPRDLVTPQAMTPPDTERRMIVIDHWRKGEPTAATKTQEQSGAVSEVAH